MSDCNECLYSSDGVCQNDECSFDLEDNCYAFESKSTYDRGYQQGRTDAIGEELQRFAQWIWDNHYLVDEAFTIRLVEQYKSEQIKE